MRKLTTIILLIAIGFAASYLLHWLVGFIAGFFVLWLGKHGRANWWMGLVAFVLIWGGYALVQNMANESILSLQIGELFGGVSPSGLILLTALLGGIGGILTGWTASAISRGDK